jgi:uncharacterized protein
MSQRSTVTNPHHPKTFRMPASPPDAGSIILKQYYFVMLIKGKDRDKITDTNVINKLQEGHMVNIKRLYNEGKLLVAGPFGDDVNWRGIFIFDCDTQEEAELLLSTDPMIKADRLGYEIHRWWTAMNSVFR